MKIRTPLILRFDTLPEGASLNDHVHWRETQAGKKAAQWATKAALLDPVFRDEHGEPWKEVGIELHFYFPNRRVRDVENFMARCKPYLDELVRAGVLEDDKHPNVLWLKGSAEVRPGEPGFELTVKQ